MCVLSGYLSIVNMVLYYCHLPMVNLDRYLAVSRPYRYPSLVTVPRARTAVVCLWCIAPLLAFGLSPSIDFYYQDVLHVCISDMQLKNVIGLLLVTLAPIAVAILLFLRLFLVARGHAAAIDAQVRVVGGNINRSNELERKTFMTFMIMTLCVTVCMVPQIVVYITEILKPGGPTRYWLICLVQILSFLNTIINVIVYYWRTTCFRNTVYDLFIAR